MCPQKSRRIRSPTCNHIQMQSGPPTCEIISDASFGLGVFIFTGYCNFLSYRNISCLLMRRDTARATDWY